MVTELVDLERVLISLAWLDELARERPELVQRGPPDAANQWGWMRTLREMEQADDEETNSGTDRRG